MRTFRAMLADDHECVRSGLRSVVESMSGWTVSGEAANGRSAVEMAELTHPNIVIMDIMMPGLNGIDATRIIRKRCPDTEVLIYSGLRDEELVQQAFDAGARSFLFKTQSIDKIIQALVSLSVHESYFTSEVGEILLSDFKETLHRKEDQNDQLSLREREVVQLLAEGHCNKEVAAILGICAKTVEVHRHAIMKKLELHAFSDLVLYAVKHHIVAP